MHRQKLKACSLKRISKMNSIRSSPILELLILCHGVIAHMHMSDALILSRESFPKVIKSFSGISQPVISNLVFFKRITLQSTVKLLLSISTELHVCLRQASLIAESVVLDLHDLSLHGSRI